MTDEPGAAGNNTQGVINRFVNALTAQKLSPEQVEVVRRALPPITASEGGTDGDR